MSVDCVMPHGRHNPGHRRQHQLTVTSKPQSAVAVIDVIFLVLYIDRDGEAFKHILSYMRSAMLNLPTDEYSLKAASLLTYLDLDSKSLIEPSLRLC